MRLAVLFGIALLSGQAHAAPRDAAKQKAAALFAGNPDGVVHMDLGTSTVRFKDGTVGRVWQPSPGENRQPEVEIYNATRKGAAVDPDGRGYIKRIFQLDRAGKPQMIRSTTRFMNGSLRSAGGGAGIHWSSATVPANPDQARTANGQFGKSKPRR